MVVGKHMVRFKCSRCDVNVDEFVLMFANSLGNSAMDMRLFFNPVVHSFVF